MEMLLNDNKTLQLTNSILAKKNITKTKLQRSVNILGSSWIPENGYQGIQRLSPTYLSLKITSFLVVVNQHAGGLLDKLFIRSIILLPRLNW